MCLKSSSIKRREEAQYDEPVMLSNFSPSQDMFLRRYSEKLSSMLLQWKRNIMEIAERPSGICTKEHERFCISTWTPSMPASSSGITLHIRPTLPFWIAPLTPPPCP